mmetsp:Transcript_8126/g.7211  ORF Transcript_8126/g.7211 Transcript_8126/m.7211 type:complete len:197 (+) Transcript_8126:489-1079(+)
MNYKTLKRPRSRMINLRQNTEENRHNFNQNSSISEISKIQLNEHAFKKLSKHWNKEIGKIKNSYEYRRRERSCTRLDYDKIGQSKPNRARMREKLKPKFSLKYKKGKNKEKLEQTMFKLMNKKDKIKHIKTLINISTDEASFGSQNIQNNGQMTQAKSNYMNLDIRFDNPPFEIEEKPRKFKLNLLNFSKLNNTIQ